MRIRTIRYLSAYSCKRTRFTIGVTNLSFITKLVSSFSKEEEGVALTEYLILLGIFIGGIIPSDDVPKLEEMGVTAVFGPGTNTEDIVSRIREVVLSG